MTCASSDNDPDPVKPDPVKRHSRSDGGGGRGSPAVIQSQNQDESPSADRCSEGAWATILTGLTEAQREAVSIINGPLLVLAAAGSGKTTVITRRIANILAHGVPPWAILALTFTNKAALEMRERVFRLLPDSVEAQGQGMTVTTFHSFCARVLRRYAEYAGLQSDYTIYDTADQKSAMKEALARLNLSKGNFPPDKVLNKISTAKNILQAAEAFKVEADGFWERNAAKCYATYQQILVENNAVDFDDLLLYVATILRDHAEVRETLQRRFRYLLIDEYQDTNHAQFVISHMLAGTGERNICVVGDPDQSIYAWRGADISNILEFQEHFPDAQTVKLGENFRSNEPILKIADQLIKHNKRRQDKPLYTTRKGGEHPIVRACIDEHHEAASVVEYFQELNVDHEIPWRDMAVLYRTNALSRVLEAEFRKSAIPYTIVRGTAFFQRREVKDALAYLRLIVNPNDEVNLRRIINTPPRGIGNTTLRKVDFFAIDQNLRLFDALKRACEVQGLTHRAVNAIAKFVKTVEGWRAIAHMPNTDPFERTDELPELVKRVLRESGMESHYKESDTDEDAERLENLNELITSAAEFEDELIELLAVMVAGADARARAGGDSGGDDRGGGDDRQSGGDESAFDPFGDPFGPLGDLLSDDSPFGDREGIDLPDSSPQHSAMDDLFAEARAAATHFDSEGENLITPTTPTPIAKLRAYLERVTLIADADAVDSESGSVLMMTLHAAKGLEFPAVAIVGLEEGLLPHNMSRDTVDNIEEERRLFFVGITRAKEHIQITRARTRTVRGLRETTIASQFLSELPEDSVQFIGDVFSASTIDDDVSEYDSKTGRSAPRLGSDYKPKWADPDQAHIKPRESTKFPIGCRVMHPQFGQGTVKSVNRTGTDLRLCITFDDVGTKTLIERYARITRIN